MTGIAELREAITVEEILSYYGADIRRSGSWSEWTPVNCPWCLDTNGSASMNRGAGLYLCHQCGAPDRANGKAGDIVDIVKFAERLNTSEAAEWLTRTFLR